MGKWFLEKLGVPHFWPKDGRHQVGDIGVTVKQFQTQFSETGECQNCSGDKVVSQPRGGRSPRLLEISPKNSGGT